MEQLSPPIILDLQQPVSFRLARNIACHIIPSGLHWIGSFSHIPARLVSFQSENGIFVLRWFLAKIHLKGAWHGSDWTIDILTYELCLYS